MKSIISVASLVAAVAAQSYSPPGAQTYGALNSPSLSDSVTTGQEFTVKWVNNVDTAGATVSLVLCNGPGSNCVLQPNAIASKIPASANSYTWSVPCGLSEGVATTATGYGMLVIVDGTGQFQYSTQFSVNKGSSCSSSSSTTASVSTSQAPPPVSSPTGPISGRMTNSAVSDGWYSWTSTFNTTSTPAYTASSKYTTAALTTVSASSVTPAIGSSTVPAKPSTFTGAAAMPTAFVNALGLIGAAGVAMFAL